MVEKSHLSVVDVTQRVGISRSFVFALIKSGDLESVKVGRRRLIPEAALEAYLNRLSAEQNRVA